LQLGTHGRQLQLSVEHSLKRPVVAAFRRLNRHIADGSQDAVNLLRREKRLAGRVETLHVPHDVQSGSTARRAVADAIGYRVGWV
jgi:hypothetical protein